MKSNIREAFSLKGDQASDHEIGERIVENGSVSGSNLYILIFAILIASIGLNMNSTAVVIGAMLISPLMGVIIKFAYGVSIQDLNMVRRSLFDFFMEFSVSIVTSTVYFMLSPINEFSGELAARTNPTLWDALIAFVGGFAAVIACTRKDKVSNVVPGAAIATALMPPLCTTGYCISTAKWISAISAFYLFFINAIFICFSSILGFYVMHVSSEKRIVTNRKRRLMLALVVAIAIVPSSILAWQTVEQYYDDQKCHRFIENEFDFENTEIVKSDISVKNKSMEIFLIGSILDDETRKSIENRLPDYELEDYDLDIIQTQIEAGVSEDELNSILDKKEKELSGLSGDGHLKQILELQSDYNRLQVSAAKDIMMLYPQVENAGFTNVTDRKGDTVFTLVLTVNKELDASQKQSLDNWIETRFSEKAEIIQIVKPQPAA